MIEFLIGLAAGAAAGWFAHSVWSARLALLDKVKEEIK
jgi:hypothetical protein